MKEMEPSFFIKEESIPDLLAYEPNAGGLCGAQVVNVFAEIHESPLTYLDEERIEETIPGVLGGNNIPLRRYIDKSLAVSGTEFYYLIGAEIQIGTFMNPVFVYQEFMFSIDSLFDTEHLEIYQSYSTETFQFQVE